MEEVRNIISEEVARIFEEGQQKTVESLQRELNSLYVFAERMETELNESKLVLRNLYNKVFQEINSKDSETLLNEVFQELMNWHLKA